MKIRLAHCAPSVVLLFIAWIAQPAIGMSLWFTLPMIDKEGASCFGYESGGLRLSRYAGHTDIVRISYVVRDEVPVGCVVMATLYAPNALEPLFVRPLNSTERHSFYFTADSEGLYRLCVRLSCGYPMRPDISVQTTVVTFDLTMEGWSSPEGGMPAIPFETMDQAQTREILGNIAVSTKMAEAELRTLEENQDPFGVAILTAHRLCVGTTLLNLVAFVTFTALQTKMMRSLLLTGNKNRVRSTQALS